MAINFTPDDVASGFNLTKLNGNFTKVDTAFQDALSRSGTGPNQMEADIDLNSNDLLNVGQISTDVLVLDGEVVQAVDLAGALKASNALSEIAVLGLQSQARNNIGAAASNDPRITEALQTTPDHPTIKTVDPTVVRGEALYERALEGTHFPRLVSSLAAATVTAMNNDVTELIYIPSTQNPAYVWIREGAELRGFWTNSATPAYVHRLRERVMIGESAGFDASTTPDTNTGASWLHTIKPSATKSNGYMETHGRVVSTGANGMQFVGATRITGAASVEGYGAIFHVRNESTNDRDCWGVYIDTVRQSATAGNMAGVELDIANCSGVTDARFLPHGFEGQPTPSAWSYGMSIASGADITVNPDALPVSHALAIIHNGSTFHTGIVIRSDALELDGSGYGAAFAVATKHKVAWHLPAGEASYITSTSTTTASGVRTLLIDNGLELRRNGNDRQFFRALTSSTAVNFLEIVANTTGSGPILRASADGDTNQNVIIQPAGTGVLQLTYAAATTADIASNRRVRIRVAGADIDLLGVLV